MNPKRKITKEQQDELVEIYFTQGREASAIKAREYGVSPKYASSIAASLGKGRPIWRKGNRYKAGHMDRRAPRSLNDPRWAWAVERGHVVT